MLRPPVTIRPDSTLGIQKALNKAGLKGEDGRALTEDGVWGPNTEFAFLRLVNEVSYQQYRLVAEVVDSVAELVLVLETRVSGLENRIGGLEVVVAGLVERLNECCEDGGDGGGTDPDPDPDPEPPVQPPSTTPRLIILPTMSTFSPSRADSILNDVYGAGATLKLHVGNPGADGAANPALHDTTPAVGKTVSFTPPASNLNTERFITSTVDAYWTDGEMTPGQTITHYTILGSDGELADMGEVDVPVVVGADGLVVEAGQLRVALKVFDVTVTPPDPEPCPAGAVFLNPGDNVQAAVSSNPPGTVFCFQPGTYLGQTISPKNNQQFIGQPGVVLDGQGANWAFRGSASNVLVSGLRVTGYSRQDVAWATAPIDPEGSTGWRIVGCEVDGNAGGGVFMRGESVVEDCDIHHNGQIGLLAGAGSRITVRNNQIHHNNTDEHDPYYEAGGTKFYRTTSALIEGNEVYSNHGPGLWCDERNTDTVYRSNNCYDNYGPGIFHEIAYEALIEGNIVTNNGHGFTAGLDGAGILVYSSDGVEVRGNTLAGNRHGICGKHSDRGSGPRGPYQLKNLNVHDNQVDVGVGRTGVDAMSDQANVYGAWGNDYQGNQYVGEAGSRFRWSSGNVGFAAWQGFGLDVEGTFDSGAPGLTGPVGPAAEPATTSGVEITATSQISSLSSGQVGLMRAGTYGSFSIPAGVTVKPYNGESVTVNGAITLGNGSTVAGLTVNPTGQWGIRLDRNNASPFTNQTIRNMRIHGGSVECVRVSRNVQNFLIEGCELSGGYNHCLKVYGENENLPPSGTIRNCLIYSPQTEDALQIERSGFVSVEHCEFGATQEERVDLKSAATVRKCQFNDASGGHLLSTAGVTGDRSIIEDNLFLGNRYIHIGANLGDRPSATLRRNTIGGGQLLVRRSQHPITIESNVKTGGTIQLGTTEPQDWPSNLTLSDNSFTNVNLNASNMGGEFTCSDNAIVGGSGWEACG